MLPLFAIASALVLGKGKQRGWGLIIFGLLAAAYPAAFSFAVLAVGIVMTL
jgi:hypothetical protein